MIPNCYWNFRQYCAGTKNAGPTGPCDAGHFCNGSSASRIQHVSPAGHFAVQGSAFATPCPLGTFQQNQKASKCNICVKGSFCNRTGLVESIPCILGHFCPDNSTVPTPCPVGTYRNVLGTQSLSDCIACKEGKYCGSTGLAAETGDCFAGYYCLKGSPTATPVNTFFTLIYI